LRSLIDAALLRSGGGGGGGGQVFLNRLDLSVNNSLVDNAQSTSPVITTRTGTSAAGAYAGGGVGNKGILGIKGFDLLPLGAVSKLDLQWHDLNGGDPVQLRPYFNLVVENLVAPGALHLISISNTLTASINDFVITNLGGDRWLYAFDAALNTVQVVGQAYPAFPVVPVFNGGPAWFQQAFKLADILAVYPTARLRDAYTADGGMPASPTITPALIVSVADSGNTLMGSRLIEQIKINGAFV
jgi:hypothetical protein